MIRAGIGWGKKVRAAGWEDTVDGLKSPVDIRRGGYIKNSEGQWCIPLEEYIADGNSDFHEAGVKFWGVARIYLSYRKQLERLAEVHQVVEVENKLKL